MKSCTIQDAANLEELIREAHRADGPVIVCDGEDECLVAMSPAVFERILFGGDALNAQGRRVLHL